MAINFPDSPTNLDEHTDSNGTVWVYDSTDGSWSPTSAVLATNVVYETDTDASGWDFVRSDNFGSHPNKLPTISGVEDYVADAVAYRNFEFILACSDEVTAIVSTGRKLTFRMPFYGELSGVRASLGSACTTGTFTVDVNVDGSTMLSTKLTIDATEKTSETAATAAVLSSIVLDDDAEITIDVDDVGDGTATGLKVVLYGVRAPEPT